MLIAMVHNKVFRARKSYICSKCGWTISKREQYLRNDNPWTRETFTYCYYCATGNERPKGIPITEFLEALEAKEEIIEKVETQKQVFLCHSKKDIKFTHELGNLLERNGIKVWIDEAEIRTGDGLISRISQGIEQVDYVIVVLSPNSIVSSWVQKEMEMAMTRQIDQKKVIVLPVIFEQCKIPLYISSTHYENYSTCKTDDEKKALLERIVQRIKL